MNHTYLVQYRRASEMQREAAGITSWTDDASFPTLEKAMEYAMSEAASCSVHEHRVVGAELRTLAVLAPHANA